MAFAVVVDSTGDLSEQEYRDLDVVMVPLTIEIDGESFKDQIEVSSEEFYKRMAAAEGLPKTSQPSPHDFVETFEGLAAKGYEHIVSLHIAGVLSGTVESARLAAEQVDVDVRVIDSASASAGLGLAVKRACALRDADVDIDEAQRLIEQTCADADFFVACGTLENLLKGGRLSADQAKDASLLNIKPIFTFDERGVLKAFSKAKGMRGVVKSFVAQLQDETAERGTQIVRFLHSGDESHVSDLKESLVEAGVVYVDGGTCLCGATVGTHLGQGGLGFACAPAWE